jgi:DNA invertase Pin-like site-specific DNA recombinase
MATATLSAPKFIGYFRVSTAAQGASGLSLDAQRAAVEAFVSRTGGELVDHFVEVESSRKHRPELESALVRCQQTGATLVVARLDRLGRDVRFLTTLMDSGAQFVALDVPGANKLTLHVLMAVAQNEREAISERTRAALQAAKARGQKLGGTHVPTDEDRRKGAEVKRRQVAERYRIVGPLAVALRLQGETLQGIADKFDSMRAQLANRGTRWTPGAVQRVITYTQREQA